MTSHDSGRMFNNSGLTSHNSGLTSHDSGRMFNCSEIETNLFVGPVQMYESIGHWTTAVYVVLVLHLLPVWVVSSLTLSRLESTCLRELRPSLAWLVCIPPALMSIITAGILLPSLGPIVELLVDVVVSVGMIQFIRFTTLLARGTDNMVQECEYKKLKLTMGAPPFVCLLPIRPTVTNRGLNLVSGVVYFLVLVRIVVFGVEICQFTTLENPYHRGFLSLENLHNVISMPVGLGGVYCYTIYLILVQELLHDEVQRNMGPVLLLLFVLNDALRLFFIFLTGTGFLSCVPPSLPLSAVEHFLKNCIKAFLVTGVGLPYLKMAGEKARIRDQLPLPDPQLSMSSSAVSEDSSTLQERPSQFMAHAIMRSKDLEQTRSRDNAV